MTAFAHALRTQLETMELAPVSEAEDRAVGQLSLMMAQSGFSPAACVRILSRTLASAGEGMALTIDQGLAFSAIHDVEKVADAARGLKLTAALFEALVQGARQ